jgi:hypothetical protein
MRAYLEEVFIEGLVLLDSGECLLQQLDESNSLGHLHHFVHLLLKCATIPVSQIQKGDLKFTLNTRAFANTFVTPLISMSNTVLHPLTFFHTNSVDVGGGGGFNRGKT